MREIKPFLKRKWRIYRTSREREKNKQFFKEKMSVLIFPPNTSSSSSQRRMYIYWLPLLVFATYNKQPGWWNTDAYICCVCMCVYKYINIWNKVYLYKRRQKRSGGGVVVILNTHTKYFWRTEKKNKFFPFLYNSLQIRNKYERKDENSVEIKINNSHYAQSLIPVEYKYKIDYYYYYYI